MEEWSDTYEELKQKDTKGPPVNGVVVTATDDHLWGEILRCSAERVSLILLAGCHLGKAEVGKQEIAIFIKEDIFWFKITIEDVLFVEMAECKSNLSNEELSLLLCKTLDTT